MPPATEGGSNGNGPKWRIPGYGAHTAVGHEYRGVATDTDPTEAQPATLHTLLERGGRVPLPAALLLFDDVLGALKRLHAVGLVHGNVRPAAVTFDPDGRCRLDDGASGRGVGALRYTAPEVLLHGDRRSTASDMYAVAVVLYEALTGHPPLLGAESLGEAQIPILARGLLEEGLAQDPRVRPRSAARYQHDLEVAAGAFLGDDWRAGGRAWLAAATRALQSDRDLLGAPWGRRATAAAEPETPSPQALVTTGLEVSGRRSATARRAPLVFLGRQLDRRHVLAFGALLAAAGLLVLLFGVLTSAGAPTPHGRPSLPYAPSAAPRTQQASPSAPVFGTPGPTPPATTPTPSPSPTATPSPTKAAQRTQVPVAPVVPPTPTPTPCFLGILC